MSDEPTTKPQRGSGTFKDPVKRARVMRMLTVGMDGMAYSQMKKNEADRAEGCQKHRVVEEITEPKFDGTEIPFSMLFIYFRRGQTYKEFLAAYPDVKEEEILQVLEAARTVVIGEGVISAAKEMIALRRDVERLNQNSASNFKKLAEAIKDMLKLR